MLYEKLVSGAGFISEYDHVVDDMILWHRAMLSTYISRFSRDA